jgi:PAS domain S-box-containing protein
MAAMDLHLTGHTPVFKEEYRIRCKDGAWKWILARGLVQRDEFGKIIRMAGSEKDITYRKIAEMELLKRDRELELIMNLTPALISYLDTELRYVRVNKTYEDWFGLAPKDMIGHSAREIIGDQTWKIAEPYLVKALAGETTGYENQLFFPNKDVQWSNVTFVPDMDENGVVKGIVVHVADVTELKNAAKELKEREFQLQLIMDMMPALISYMDTDFRYLRVNKAYEDWFDLVMKDIIGRTALEIVGENAWAVAAPYFEAARQGKKSKFDNRLIFFDNTIHWVQTTVIPDIDADGQVKGLLIHAADINDRKQYEQQISNLNHSLRIKADELQLIFDTVPIGLAITHDTEGMHTQGNKVLENTIGLPWRSELSFRSVAPQAYQVYEDNKQLSVDQLPMQRAVRGEAVTNQLLEIMRPDDKSITVLANANPLFDKAGNITGAVGAFQDISELKRIQDTFLQSHQLLQTLIEQASIGIAMFDHDMNYLVSSPKWSLDHGVNPLNLAGLNHYKLFPDLPAEWKQYHQRGLAGEFIKNEMDSWIRADGGQRWLRWSLGPWTALDRTIGGIIITTEDITDRKLVEDNLQASELRVSIALEELKAGYWDWDFKTNAAYFSPVWKQQLGFTENEIPNRYEEWEQRLHPGDRQIALDRIKQHLAGKSPTFEMEFRLLHKNGTYRNIHSHGALIRDENNEPYRMVGIHLDVTDYQKAKQVEYQQKLLDETAELFIATQTAIAIAHDLNQPLNAVVHFADAAVELFKTGDASQQMLIYALENCSEQAYRAGKVIPQLIGVLNKSEHIDVNEAVDINQVIDETLILLKNSHFYDAVNTELILESGLPQIQISRLHLQKVVYNLMQNGYDAMIDFGKNDGILMIVTRRFPDAPDTLEVIIRDEGTGVTNKNQLKKIFQPFYTTKKMGSGMGLAICQDLIKASGGELWAEQNIGPGLSLHVTLPFIK